MWQNFLDHPRLKPVRYVQCCSALIMKYELLDSDMQGRWMTSHIKILAYCLSIVTCCSIIVFTLTRLRRAWKSFALYDRMQFNIPNEQLTRMSIQPAKYTIASFAELRNAARGKHSLLKPRRLLLSFTHFPLTNG